MAKLLNNRYDIGLIDYNLGASTGFDLVREAVHMGVVTPLILLTGHGDEQVAVDTLKTGAADYLIKGRVTEKALQRSINNAIDKAQLAHEVAVKRVELQRANQELERKNADIRSFYHTVSHELKNPLASAKEFASILQEGLLGSLTDEQMEAVEIIQGSCQQMATMINDLLDSSRLENGKLSLMLEPVQLDTLAPEVVRSMVPMSTQKGVQLCYTGSPNLEAVQADPARIRQVLTNLVNNAIKFTEQGGEITVSVTSNHDELLLCVSDTGVGIPPTHLDSIFQRFQQADNARDQARGGLGLGLAIVKGIVDLHGGRIWVESQLGKGSTFNCVLPRIPESEALPKTLPGACSAPG